MKKIKTLAIVSSLLFAVSCSNNESQEQKATHQEDPHASLVNEINRLEKEMHKSMQIDNVTATQAIRAYSEFSTSFPNDSLTPDYLFKAAEIATATQQYPQALQYYQTITTKYPNYKLIQESLFLQASVLDNYINDDAKAKVIYEEVISKYPTSNYANDAKAAISNLGKSDDELIKEFKKKNGEK